jgi:hypothetical protein
MFKKEERVCPRAELTWPVAAQVDGGLIKGETKNISTQGAYVCCGKPLKLNEVYDMVISAPEKPMNVKAEVVWSNIYGPNDKINPRGMGVRFVHISEDDQKLIAQELGQHNLGKVACDFMDTLEIQLIEDLAND